MQATFLGRIGPVREGGRSAPATPQVYCRLHRNRGDSALGLAAGRNASALSRQGSRSPVAYIDSLIAPDGSARYSRTGAQTPVWVTAQALTALAGRPLPIAPVR